MKYVVAVSGGVDSVVLLHKLVQQGEHELIVAHFDHGIRDDSADDARFVQSLSESYGLSFVTEREELGVNASEDRARTRRYSFLRQVAGQQKARIVTAHHANDVVETVAINLQRGTGWRGLAVLNAPDVERPLLSFTKGELYDYALAHRLEWVQDSTNLSDVYLRNRLRYQIAQIGDVSKEVGALRRQQKAVMKEADEESERLIGAELRYPRYLFLSIDELVARELLRAAIIRQYTPGATRPQLDKAVLAIKTAQPGSVHQIGGGVELRFTKRDFVVETA